MQLTAAEVLSQGLALSPVEREQIAEKLWQSLPEPTVNSLYMTEILCEAERRDSEMSAGTVEGREHKDVIAAARQSLRCE